MKLLSVIVTVMVTVRAGGAMVMIRDENPGLCPQIVNKQDFDPVPYLGTWYEEARFNILWEGFMDCVQAIYSDLGDGNVEVHNVARTQEGNFTDIVGVAHVVEPGVLLVEFAGHIPAKYHVLDTDYEKFSAVYNCVQAGPVHFEYAWVLSREPELDSESFERARLAFENNNIDLDLFHRTHQGEDCGYLTQ